MAEVVITLSLSRKSGILASAISTISRAGLDFDRHRFIDLDEGHGIRLRASSSGELTEADELLRELGELRGVSGVLDLEVDGRSLLHEEAPAEELSEDVGAVATDSIKPEATAPVAVAEEEQEAESAPAVAPVSPVQAPAAAAAAPYSSNPASSSQSSTNPPSNPANSPASSPASVAAEPDVVQPVGSNTSMRPSMIRRRRRRR